MTDRLLRAIGVVALACVTVVVLAPFVLRVLPALLVIALVIWGASLLFKGWGRGF